MKLEKYVEPMVYVVKSRPSGEGSVLAYIPIWSERFEQAITSTREIISKVWLFMIIGIGIGAFIHGFIPEQALTDLMGQGAWWSVPMAVLSGISLYSNATGVIPIVSALLAKGAALGTALAFMMSVVALSLLSCAVC